MNAACSVNPLRNNLLTSFLFTCHISLVAGVISFIRKESSSFFKWSGILLYIILIIRVIIGTLISS